MAATCGGRGMAARRRVAGAKPRATVHEVAREIVGLEVARGLDVEQLRSQAGW